MGRVSHRELLPLPTLPASSLPEMGIFDTLFRELSVLKLEGTATIAMLNSFICSNSSAPKEHSTVH